MPLAFSSTRTNCPPTDQISNILRADQIKKLGSARKAKLVDITQQFSGGTQATIDLKTVVKTRIIDQTFPADSGTGFFEINPHHHDQFACDRRCQRTELSGVFHTGFRIMD